MDRRRKEEMVHALGVLMLVVIVVVIFTAVSAVAYFIWLSKIAKFLMVSGLAVTGLISLVWTIFFLTVKSEFNKK